MIRVEYPGRNSGVYIAVAREDSTGEVVMTFHGNTEAEAISRVLLAEERFEIERNSDFRWRTVNSLFPSE